MSWQREQFMNEVASLAVLDTHTHLVGDRLCAKDFWEIAHYFWFFRELQAAGYPADAMDLPEEERIIQFLAAYRATRNTLMNWVVTHVFKTLYDIELSDEPAVRRADAAVRESSQREGWAQQVADKLQIRGFVVNIPEHAEFQGMDRNALLIPRIDGRLGGWIKNIQQAEDPSSAFEEVAGVIGKLLEDYRQLGCTGIMTTLPEYEARANETYPLTRGIPKDQIMMRLLHKICEELEGKGMFLQLFLGVERSWCGTAVPVNDPARILKLTGLFERYSCKFELVVASEMNNLDVVQAAWNFPNVHLGGLWWFNFRASTYRDCMQYRSEALPGIKCSLIASDARCIEWSYGKILLVKRLMGEYLYGQIEAGWLNRDTALQLAEAWLYKSAAQRYGLAT
ncbi:glucuronate isomerase [Paenibacillus radicis (ex Xue et al. 2023)]|uniref:Glucuronate isomerase n=1 Tax=Paenibacillus radicis (ex Xue et al. 2023) TaxID=2972489 RepID=A0ABT1YRU5_9BACL|nr:glucuronate isomerase [Paenibacillus radicis (ex Xue et al. 2023)]MCR8635099.1 glucuronate isomerase [Paenibacillus radicis (ex Xue et al. 2023)]